jgi:hypothetical protein
MLDRRHFLAVSSAAVAAPALAAPAAKPSGRRAEVRALRAFAEATHPRGREAAASKEWVDRWARIEAGADRLADGAYFVGVRRALGWFEDGHTTVLPFEFIGGVPPALKTGPFGLELPLRVRTFHDGAFVTATDEGGATLGGRRIDRVGTMSTIDFMRAHARHWPGNKAWSHRWAGSDLASPAQLQGFGAIADASRAVAFATETGAIEIAPRKLGAGPPVQIDRTATPREGWAKEAGGGNYVRPLPERKALYVSIDDMDDVDGKTFEQLTREALAAMGGADVDRLVIDLRRNGGGNNYWGEPLRKSVEASRFNRPGALYVLISPVTFSAAQNLANRLERETFAIFVGEPTGGAPNHYGDAKVWQGPATGISAMVSTIPWFDSYPQDKRAWIMPDLPAPSTFADWQSGMDRALELALSHEDERPADFLTRDRVFYYERASQKSDWKPFWG